MSFLFGFGGCLSKLWADAFEMYDFYGIRFTLAPEPCVQGPNPAKKLNLNCIPSVLDIWGLLTSFCEFLELLVVMRAS